MIPLFGPIMLKGTSVGIATEFGGAAPHALSEYYRGGATGYVVAGASPKIATAGAQAFSNYRGAVLPVVAPPTPGAGGVVVPQPAQPAAPTAIPELAPGWEPDPRYPSRRYTSLKFYLSYSSASGIPRAPRFGKWIQAIYLPDAWLNSPFTQFELTPSNRESMGLLSKIRVRNDWLEIYQNDDSNMRGETRSLYAHNAVGRSTEYFILDITPNQSGNYTSTQFPLQSAAGGAAQPRPRPPVVGTGGQAVGSSGTQGVISSTFTWQQTGTNDWIFPNISDEFQSNVFAAATDGFGFAINQVGLYQDPVSGSCYMTLAFSGRPTGQEYQINVVFNGNPPMQVSFVSAANGWTGDSYVFGPFNFPYLVRGISPLPGSGSFSAVKI